MAGFLVKSFGGCCANTVLTGASCWPSSNCIPAQKIVSMSTIVLSPDRRQKVFNRGAWHSKIDKNSTDS